MDMSTVADRIVDAALELLNKEGLDRLSTRRLAKELNIQGPSLYHHFHNKAELLGYMAASMVQRTLMPLNQNVPWDRWLWTLAHATREMVLACRDGARLLASSYPNEDMQHELVPGIAQPLINADFQLRMANECTVFVASYVIGWTITEQNERMRGFMGTVLEIPIAFSHGVEVLVRGISELYGKPLSADFPNWVNPPAASPTHN
jgi:TetR/AcrR family tetracycline transcriptional repressor